MNRPSVRCRNFSRPTTLTELRGYPRGTSLLVGSFCLDKFRRELFMAEDLLIYASSNGDRWYLVRDNADAERLRVRHQPNPASGGRSSTVDVDEFLAEGHGPQHEALNHHLQQLGIIPLSE